jgi:hypothetical protein
MNVSPSEMKGEGQRKEILSWIIRSLVTGVLAGVILWRLDLFGPKGFFALLSHSDRKGFLLGVVLLLGSNALTSWRWQILLRAQGIGIFYLEAFRLTHIGFAFNNFLPGPVGGDVVKAYYAGKGTPRPTESFVSVFADRIIGVLSLALMVALFSLVQIDRAAVRTIGLVSLIVLVLFGVGFWILCSERLRSVLFRFQTRFPSGRLGSILESVRRSILVYRTQWKVVVPSIGISLISNLIVVAVHFIFGKALGIRGVSWGEYLVFVPGVVLLSAIPVSIGGWGYGEALYWKAFGLLGVGVEASIALSLSYHLAQVAWSSLGIYFYLKVRTKRPDRA